MSLLTLLRELYINGIASLAERKLQNYIETHCLACVTPDCGLNQAGHDLCMMMSWDEQIRSFLPKILKRLTAQEINNAIRLHYKKDDGLRETLQILLEVRRSFSLRTFLYICSKDMCTDVEFQTRIALAVFKIRTQAYTMGDGVFEKFEEKYREAILPI